MVLKDPTFINKDFKGLYIWESSWEGHPDPQDDKIKLGVQITPLEEILHAYQGKGHVFIRKLACGKETFNSTIMQDIHSVVYDKPYDIVPKDWIEAFFKKDDHPQKTDRFWCSALVGYIYTRVGVLTPETDWSMLTPNDFSLSGENLSYKGIDRLLNFEHKIM